MSSASRFVICAVVRLVWAKSVRGLTVLLLGGVLVIMLVHAVEGQDTRDPVSQPVPPVVASGDSSGAPSLGGSQVAAAQGQRRGDAPVYDAAYLIRIPESSKTYSEIDAERMRWYPIQFPSPSDGTHDAMLIREWLTIPRRWARVPLPAEVEKVLGNPDVYIVSGGGNEREMWAVRAGRHYRLPGELNQLAVDAGYSFARSDVPQVLRVCCFFSAASVRLHHEVPEGAASPYGDPGGGLDSLFRGDVPLVKPLRVEVLRQRFANDTGPEQGLALPRFAAGVVLGRVNWADSRDTVTLTFMGSVGFDSVVFPEVWTIGLPTQPGFRRVRFNTPGPPPEKR